MKNKSNPSPDSVFQQDVLRSNKRFLEDLLENGAAGTDPEVLYRDTCLALGESPKERILE